MQLAWISLEDLFGHRLTNGTGPPQDKEPGLANDIRQLLFIFTNIINEQVFITTNETQNIILHIKNTNLKFSSRRTCKYINGKFSQGLLFGRYAKLSSWIILTQNSPSATISIQWLFQGKITKRRIQHWSATSG
ncbi:hypothetical protein NMD14_06520 [Aeromonas veronii]